MLAGPLLAMSGGWRYPQGGTATLERLLARAWAVLVPSHTEVVGMANLEAACAGAPSITTHAAGLHDWDAGGGILIEGTVGSLRDAMVTAAARPLDAR